MSTPFSGSLIPIGRFRSYQEPYKLTVVLRPQGYSSTNHLTFQGFPICLCDLIQFIPEPWRRNLRKWLIRLTHFRFPEDSIYGIPGMFQEGLQFLSRIQFDSWLTSLLEFLKVLVSFRVLNDFSTVGLPKRFPRINIYLPK